MPLAIHLLIHFTLAVLSGYLIGRFFDKEKIGLIFGVLGGFLIDLDHVLEYFLVFGLNFNLQHFIESRQFLVSDQIRLYFHAWEYLPILLVIAYIFRKKRNIKIALITLAFAGTIHLISDVFINNYYFKYYSIYYRASLKYADSDLLPSGIYDINQEYKIELGL
ncbi:MAG TPA: hypothetical protein VFD51_00665 [Patescibacteria group bacterium]|nr:hypothetical protein [Patescibacteria group bacterium]